MEEHKHKEENREEMGKDVSLPVEGVSEKSGKKVISVKSAVVIALLLVLVALAYVYKGLVIAATVNGSPISRFAVMNELEKGSGKAALDLLITQKLIENEAAKKNVTISGEELNAEIQKIDSQIKIQGSSLDTALLQQGISMEEFKKQVLIQKKLEKLVEDVGVTDEEVERYITTNSISVPEGSETDMRNQIREGLRQQKLGAQIDMLIQSLKSQATIRYFASYAK